MESAQWGNHCRWSERVGDGRIGLTVPAQYSVNMTHLGSRDTTARIATFLAVFAPNRNFAKQAGVV